MSFSALATAVVFGLLALYALLVSVFPIVPLQQRSWIADVAAYLVIAYVAVVAFELHVVLLQHLVNPGEQNTGVSRFLAFAKGYVTYLAPLVALLAPFLRTLGEAATSGRGAGASGFISKILSRIAIILVAIFVPLLLWGAWLLLLRWGMAGCATISCERCDYTLASRPAISPTGF